MWLYLRFLFSNQIPKLQSNRPLLTKLKRTTFNNMRFLKLFVFSLIVLTSCHPPIEDNQIVIVNCGKLGRKKISREIKLINEYGPKVLGVDVRFSKDSGNVDDDLIPELNKCKNLVMVQDLLDFDDKEQTYKNHKISAAKFTKNARTGFGNIFTDEDSLVSYFDLYENYSYYRIRSFGLQVALLADSIKARKFESLEADNIVKINFTEKAHRFRVIQPEELFNKTVDLNSLKDKIVLFGYVGDDEEDRFFLKGEGWFPWSTTPIYGVTVHANIISMILNDKR
jgi:CHASE2 domain-containing sensor protein